MKADAWYEIYRQNIWNGVESLSGPGSGDSATAPMKEELATLVRTLDVDTVLDVACGDGYWMPPLPGYVGIDVAPQAIARARQNHPDREYVEGDFLTANVRADLIIMRDVLQHLSLEVAKQMVRRALLRCEWLLASSYKGGKNTGLSYQMLMKGKAFDCNLEQPPFRLGQPIAWIPDGYAYDGHGIRDERKILGLWRGMRD